MAKEWEKRYFFLHGPSKRRSNREIFRSQDFTKEQAFMQVPGDEMIPVTQWSTHNRVSPNDIKTYRILKEKGKQKYRDIHTHLYHPKEDPERKLSALPAEGDVEVFLRDLVNSDTMVIAQVNSDNGDLRGYTMLFKRPNSNHDFIHPYTDSNGETHSIKGYFDYRAYQRKNPDKITVGEAIDKQKAELRLGGVDIRYYPARGYYLDRNTGNYEEKKHNLEGAVASILIGSILLFLFLKIPLSGSVISNVVSSSGFGLGFGIAIFLVLVLGVGVYFLVKPYRRK